MGVLRLVRPREMSPVQAASMSDLDNQGPVRVPRFGLSGKLLVLTILFVMIVQVMIYVPSVSIHRLNWLNDRLAAARTAALVLYAAPSGMVPDDLARDILTSIGAQAVVMKTGQTRRLLAVTEMPTEIHRNFDLREVGWLDAVGGAYHALFDPKDSILRVVGAAPRDGEFLEILIRNEPLQRAMLRFSRNVVAASLVISASTLALVYLALHFMFVRPMRRITRNIMAFRADPENPSRTIRVSKRNDEIGVTERELASMQSNLTSMLHQRSRLAALGLAVSKINHDLRNMLASAQLVSDQLSSVRDPRVQRFAPKLVRTLERAIEFCQSTLSYGRAQEAPPDRRMIPVEPLVEEVRETVGLNPESNIGWIVSIDRGLEMDADHDHMFRVLLNLTRNAVQALEARAPNNALRDQVRVTGRREGGVVVIEVSDTGPGFPPRAREHLFQAFSGSARPGGTGLGLAIAAELVRAHGGEIRLIEGTIGATFHLTIPDQAVDLDAWREERASA
jgi:signal transduction histidine kinase